MKRLLFIFLFISCNYCFGQKKLPPEKELYNYGIGLKQALREKNPDNVKNITIREYSDTIFPNNDLLKFKNLEHISVFGKMNLKKKRSDPLQNPSKFRIDTNRLNQLKHLKYLHFYQIDFKRFPVEICYLRNLKGLGMAFCFIDTIPREIENLKSLEVLSLALALRLY